MKIFIVGKIKYYDFNLFIIWMCDKKFNEKRRVLYNE